MVASQLNRPILLIGYGNTLRRDDALGRRAAEMVESWRLPGLRCLSVTQLTPELAEPLSSARTAIFVDIRLSDADDTVRVEPIGPAIDRGGPTTHFGDPAGLLSMALAVYGRCPDAWVVSAPAADLGFGDALSPVGERGLAEALDAIARLVREHGFALPTHAPAREVPACMKSR